MNEGFLIFLYLLMIITFTVFIGCADGFWLKVKSFFHWFFDFNYGLGPENNYGHPQYTPQHTPNKRIGPCALHHWIFHETVKHEWKIVNNKPMGLRNTIDDIIEAIVEKPSHTETPLQEALDWKSKGYDVAFTSWHRWRCAVCGEIKKAEFYTMPSKFDGTPMNIVYDLTNNVRKKQTQQISTFNSYGRREIPVEPMKKY